MGSRVAINSHIIGCKLTRDLVPDYKRSDVEVLLIVFDDGSTTVVCPRRACIFEKEFGCPYKIPTPT